MDISALQSGRVYTFHIKPAEAPTGETVPVSAKKRVFVGPKYLDGIPFIEVKGRIGKNHLIAIGAIDKIEPAGQEN